MSKLVLHMRPASPPSSAVRMLGDILGLQWQLSQPDVLALEHKSPEFRKKNPMGTIPVLEDGDFILSDSHAIMKYLLSKYGRDHKDTFYPSDARVRALIDEKMYFDAAVFFISLKSVALPTLLQGLKSPSEKHIKDIDDAYSTVERYLSRNKYIAADHITLADLSCGSTATAMQPIHKLDHQRFPRCSEWLQKLEEETYFQKINAPGVLEFTKLLKYFWKINKNNKV